MSALLFTNDSVKMQYYLQAAAFDILSMTETSSDSNPKSVDSLFFLDSTICGIENLFLLQRFSLFYASGNVTL